MEKMTCEVDLKNKQFFQPKLKKVYCRQMTWHEQHHGDVISQDNRTRPV